MSTTSSSDNDYCTTLYHESSIRSNINATIFPYVGRHPFVYYSNIPVNQRTERKRVDNKSNPNCFVKAFRWYTQELVSPQTQSTASNVNIGGFAEWLDKKYQEFLHENERQENGLQFRSRQRSMVERDKFVNSSKVQNKPRKTKKFSRMKSPWKKKRRFVNDRDRDGLINEHSFEFILQPQDLSRPVSECCQKTSCCNRSDATFITSKTTFPTKIKIKSHSMMCITKARDVYEQQIDAFTYGGSKEQRTEGKAKEVLKKRVQDKPMKSIVKDVSCECLQIQSKVNASNRDTISSEIKPPISTTKVSQPLTPDKAESYLKPYNKDTRFVDANVVTNPEVNKALYKATPKQKLEHAENCCQCSLYSTIDASNQQNNINDQDLSQKVTCLQENYQAPFCQLCPPQQQKCLQEPPCSLPSKTETFVATTNNRKIPIRRDFLNHSVQTSDHSIIFRQDKMSNVPLFMTIACGTKLCENVINIK